MIPLWIVAAGGVALISAIIGGEEKKHSPVEPVAPVAPPAPEPVVMPIVADVTEDKKHVEPPAEVTDVHPPVEG